MFCSDMKLTRTLRVAFAWLSLVLPLQGFAAAPCGLSDPMSAAGAAVSPATQHHCAPASSTSHHPSCGTCCCGVAIAPLPGAFIAPLPTPSEIFNAVFSSPPEGVLDRLDRPPRRLA